MTSPKTTIAAKLLQALDSLSDDTNPGVGPLKYRAFDKVRMSAADFKEHELPAVQLIDVSDPGTHQIGAIEKDWQLSLELIMRSNEVNVVQQSTLWDLMYDIERALWSRPNLGIPGVLHLYYIGWVTDLHMADQQLYFARLDFSVIHRYGLTATC